MLEATAAIGGITGDLIGALGLRQALVTREPQPVVGAT